MADEIQRIDEDIRRRAQRLENISLKAMDALHIACAEAANSDYFLTCDDRMIRRYQGELKVVSPVDFVMSIMGGSS
jgi:predicted nucleic acid-binding protein